MVTIPTLFLSGPVRPPSTSPYLDRLTLRVTAAWRSRTQETAATRGSVQVCTCGALPVAGETYIIGSKNTRLRVDALCVHRVAYHRDELTPHQFDLLVRLGKTEELPTEEELRDPPVVRR